MKFIWSATSDWLQIATREGLSIDWDAEPITSDEWDVACGCSFDPTDPEVGFGVLVRPREQDTRLRAGDIVGFDGDTAVFLRRGKDVTR